MNTAGIKQFSMAGLTRVNKKQRDAQVEAAGLDADRLLVTKFEKHAQDFRVRTRNAVELLTRLPGPAEVLTVLMSGKFDGYDYVAATLQLAAPARIDELYIATLGFSDDNAGQLLQQLDAGTIGRVWFVASCYMRDKHGEKFGRLSEVLTKRGHRIRATRNHAKLIAMRLSDGRTISIDGSLNFCSCSMVEQAHVWGDPALYTFYAAYIREHAEGTDYVK